MLYDRALFERAAVDPRGPLRQAVVRRHRAEAEVVSWPEAALRDIDVAEDYERASRRQTPADRG